MLILDNIYQLEQGQPYLAAKQGIYELAIETKKEKIARPESRRKRGSSRIRGYAIRHLVASQERGRQDERNNKPLRSPLIVI